MAATIPKKDILKALVEQLLAKTEFFEYIEEVFWPSATEYIRQQLCDTFDAIGEGSTTIVPKDKRTEQFLMSYGLLVHAHTFCTTTRRLNSPDFRPVLVFASTVKETNGLYGAAIVAICAIGPNIFVWSTPLAGLGDYALTGLVAAPASCPRNISCTLQLKSCTSGLTRTETYTLDLSN